MTKEKYIIEILDRVTRIEERVKTMQKHTSYMNKEMGQLRDRIVAVEDVCKEIKFTWKIVAFLLGLLVTIITILTRLGVL